MCGLLFTFEMFLFFGDEYIPWLEQSLIERYIFILKKHGGAPAISSRVKGLTKFLETEVEVSHVNKN